MVRAPEGYRKLHTMEKCNTARSLGNLAELCTCGHLQSDHWGQIHSGGCNYVSDDMVHCNCIQFTFSAFIERTEP